MSRDFPWLDRFLLVMFIIGIHLRLSLRTDDAVLVPMYFSVISGAIITYRSTMEVNQYFKVFSPLAIFLALMWLVNIFLGGDIVKLTKGAVQFYVSIVVAFGVALTIARFESKQAVSFFTKVWFVFFFLAIIELYGASAFFQTVTDKIYSGLGRGVYESLDRDLSIYGRVRPHVFASEPSFLAYTLNILCLLTFLKGARLNVKRAFITYVLMLVASNFVAPSFTSVFFVGAIAVWHFWPKTTATRVGMLFLIVLAIGAHSIFFGSVADITISEHQNSGSFFGRIVAGPPVAYQALLERPFFGFGVGDADSVTPIIVDVWNAYGAFSDFPWYVGLKGIDLMSNGFWWQWIYFGGVGCVIYIFILNRMTKKIGADQPLRIFFCSCVVWYTGAALVDIASWYVFTAFLAGSIEWRELERAARRSVPRSLDGLKRA